MKKILICSLLLLISILGYPQQGYYYEGEFLYVYTPGPDDDPNGAEVFYKLYCIEKED